MNTYHICYYTDETETLSSSKNIEAETYGAAEQKFIEKYGKFHIIYIKQMVAVQSIAA